MMIITTNPKPFNVCIVDLTFSEPRKVLSYELVLVIRNLMGS